MVRRSREKAAPPCKFRPRSLAHGDRKLDQGRIERTPWYLSDILDGGGDRGGLGVRRNRTLCRRLPGPGPRLGGRRRTFVRHDDGWVDPSHGDLLAKVQREIDRADLVEPNPFLFSNHTRAAINNAPPLSTARNANKMMTSENCGRRLCSFRVKGPEPCLFVPTFRKCMGPP